jgi:hypothetical protein
MNPHIQVDIDSIPKAQLPSLILGAVASQKELNQERSLEHFGSEF